MLNQRIVLRKSRIAAALSSLPDKLVTVEVARVGTNVTDFASVRWTPENYVPAWAQRIARRIASEL